MSLDARTGCDLQPVAPVADAVAHFGRRYLDRVYTPAEQEAGRRGGAPALAARFAAKEAVLKLIGTADGVDPRSVRIGTDAGSPGRPTVELTGRAAALAALAGVGAIDISLSHTADLAMAVATTIRSFPAPSEPARPDDRPDATPGAASHSALDSAAEEVQPR